MALDHKSTLAEQYFVLMWTRGLWCLSQPGLSTASGFLLASYLTHARFSPKPYSPQSSSLPQTQIMGSDFLSFSMKKSETLQHEFLLVPTSHSDTPLCLLCPAEINKSNQITKIEQIDIYLKSIK